MSASSTDTALLYTIGHSNHKLEKFTGLLLRHGITAVADVRSRPYSRFSPQYSQKAFKASLEAMGIAYVFLGRELGARSENPACYRDGKVQYDLLAQQPEFSEGLDRVREGMLRYNIALMCAEKDPINCHRALLVARKLFEAGLDISHIHADGELESHDALEERLLDACKLNVDEPSMFGSRTERVAQAYSIHTGQF